MPNQRGTTARLRRTFHYPEEDSTDSQPEVLDEQEQEAYINQLAAENAARDVQFRRFLLAIPLLATIPYLPALINPPTAMLALLSPRDLHAAHPRATSPTRPNTSFAHFLHQPRAPWPAVANPTPDQPRSRRFMRLNL
jgi:hypothetical protein